MNLPGRHLLPTIAPIFTLSLMTDHTILTATGVFAFGLTGLIVCQYHAPHTFRPLTLAKRVLTPIGAAIRSTRAHTAERKAALALHRSRPCWQCHTTGPFHTDKRTKGRPGSTLAIEILIILFIIAPLTLGLGLLLLPLLLIGNPSEKIQTCQNCGAERPY